MDTPEEIMDEAEIIEDDLLEETVAVFAAPDAMTAEVVRGMLLGEGIVAVIGEQVTSAVGGALAIGEGFWGEVRVPATQAEAARALLEAYETGDSDATSEALSQAADAAYDPEV
jgi:hypothetical protein